MTVLNNSSIFQPSVNKIRVINKELVVISGANKLASLPLCSLSIDYNQYIRTSVQVPKNKTDFLLSFPMIGVKPTFVMVIAKYCDPDSTKNYLKWKFSSSSDAKLTMNSMLSFTGTTTTPVPSILIDNLNETYTVQLEILVGSMSNDYIDDVTDSIYISGIVYSDIRTQGLTTSGILELYNANNELVTSFDLSELDSIERSTELDRVIITQGTVTIVLDFIDSSERDQAFSALTWILKDVNNRSLPQPKDLAGPVVTYTGSVISDAMAVSFDYAYTESNFITDAIDTVIDARDGIITLTGAELVITDITGAEVEEITTTGVYTMTLTITDLAGNTTSQTVEITATKNVVDTAGPVITFNDIVTSNNILSSIDINNYPSGFTYNDAKVLSILSVVDNIDGTMPLSGVSVVFKDNNGDIVASPITAENHYSAIFTATDAALNSTVETVTFYLNDTTTDVGPEIYLDNITMPGYTATVSLAVDYGSGDGVFTKLDALNRFVDHVDDDVDGTIVLTTSNITMFNPGAVSVITTPGAYTIIVTATDSDSNTSTKTINLTVTV